MRTMRRMFLLGLSLVCLFAGTSSFGGREVLAANEKDYARLANHISNLLQCARLIIARNQDVINTHGAKLGEPIPEDAPVSYKGFVPAIVGRLVTDEFMTRTGVTIKQTTMGKNGRGPRNVYNAPDNWEKAALGKLNSRSYPKGAGFGEFTNLEGDQVLVYRYMMPLYIEAPCLKCHGDPANSPTGDGLDIAGYPMEGYKEGELRGGISVTIPVTDRQAFFVNTGFLDLEESKGP